MDSKQEEKGKQPAEGNWPTPKPNATYYYNEKKELMDKTDLHIPMENAMSMLSGRGGRGGGRGGGRFGGRGGRGDRYGGGGDRYGGGGNDRYGSGGRDSGRYGKSDDKYGAGGSSGSRYGGNRDDDRYSGNRDRYGAGGNNDRYGSSRNEDRYSSSRNDDRYGSSRNDDRYGSSSRNDRFSGRDRSRDRYDDRNGDRYGGGSRDDDNRRNSDRKRRAYDEPSPASNKRREYDRDRPSRDDRSNYPTHDPVSPNKGEDEVNGKGKTEEFTCKVLKSGKLLFNAVAMLLNSERDSVPNISGNVDVIQLPRLEQQKSWMPRKRAFFELKPAESRDKNGFADFVDYLHEKKKGRVGLAKVGSLTLFILPRCDLVSSLGYKLDNSKLLAIVG